MKKTIKMAVLLLFITFIAQSQTTKKDTFSLKRVLSEGKIKGSIRQFSMLTDNFGNLTDYYAIAIGAGLNYETKRWRGFQLNFGGFFVHDLASSDFSKTDPTTKTLSRYDAGLFDVLELNNPLISRIENLNIKYFYKKTAITFGKQILKTPLVNPQDGRMNNSMMEGFYFDFNEIKNFHLEGGWLYRSSPRSTVKWFDISESIGTYPMGLNADGTKGNYLGNIASKGLLVLGGNYNFSKNIKLTAWNYLIENVSNTAMVQYNQEFRAKNSKLKYGFQFFNQKAIKNGGNPDQSKTYMAKGSKSMFLGAMIGFDKKNNGISLNFSRITAKGRFQFPREWGRDPFFTFLQRERNEGLGDTWAMSTNFSHKIPTKNLQIELGYGKYKLPNVKDFRLNKYGLPSYSQANFSLKYQPKGIFDGIEILFLGVRKFNNGELYNDEKYRINKVDMLNYNLVLNYNF